MNNMLLRLVAAPVLLIATSNLCQAQLIVVRPGYVRAPFVRVYRNPDGSSSVRAPFVGVDSRGVPPRAVYTRRGPIPTLGELAELDLQSLRLALRQSAWELDEALSQFPTGAVWVSHFQTRTILELATREDETPLTKEEQARLVEILQIFDAAMERSELRAIHRLNSFRFVHAALREYLTRVGLSVQGIEELPTPTPRASPR